MVSLCASTTISGDKKYFKFTPTNKMKKILTTLLASTALVTSPALAFDTFDFEANTYTYEGQEFYAENHSIAYENGYGVEVYTDYLSDRETINFTTTMIVQCDGKKAQGYSFAPAEVYSTEFEKKTADEFCARYFN